MALIEARNLTKVYSLGDVEVRALDGISTTIEKGEFVAIMGQSGSGKSTFMNVLGCLDTPTDGHYLLDGVDTGGLSRDALAEIRNKKLGFVFQGFNLLSRTSAVENVELPLLYNGSPARERNDRARTALKSVGLEGREGHHPNQLSGGQQQRVAIARALVGPRRLVLADEPTGALDSVTGEDVMRLLRARVDAGAGGLLVTHEARFAAWADRTVFLRDGVVVDSTGSPAGPESLLVGTDA